ncbi:MAG: Gx transporter family protein [Clostridia bacterium]|nr:Gx transporter family protein [Clostridia bacterium]
MNAAQKQARRVALCGMLLALMLVLGFVESQLPVAAGIPGIKLGLSNGVLIFAVYMLNIPTAYLLMGLKVLLSGLLFGSPSAMMYAFAGGVLSLTVMALLSRLRGVSPVVISMIGGLCHNVGQVALAMVILHTPKLVYYMAVLMVVGMITGLATGLAANGIIRRFQKEKQTKV